MKLKTMVLKGFLMHNNLILENFDESFLRLPSLIDERKKAFSELKKVGIKPQISGRGLIVSQSIEAGTKVEKKSICILKAELKE